MNYQSVITLNTKSRTELTWWIENLRFCNGRTFSQLNPQMITQTDASLTGWEAVCNRVQTSGQWSEEERTLHINVLELLAIKLDLFSFTKGKRVKDILFQIDNKAALSYPLKMGGTRNEHMIKLSKEIWHYLLNHNVYHSRIPAFSTEYSSRQGIKKKNRLFRVASSSQIFQVVSRLLGSPTIDLLASRLCHKLPQYIAWHPDPYSQGTDAMIENWNIGLPYEFPPFSMVSRMLLKIKHECSSSPDFDCTSLEYPAIVPGTLKPVSLNQCCWPKGKEILISPKNIVHLLMVESSLALAVWLVSGKPFCVKEFPKTLHTLSQIPDEQAHSLIMSQPGENGLAGILNEKLILFTHLQRIL